MKILIRGQIDRQWHLVGSAAYANEDELQRLLAESPGLISIDEIRPGSGQLLIAVREFPLPVGSIDLLGFTADGDIAIIECKRAANPEVKRKVIGQVLEYGAHLWEMRYEDVDEAVRLRNGNSLAELVRSAVRAPEWDEESFRSNVESALTSGNFILIIVVDEINDELARIVRFLNASGSLGFAFAALEMRRFQAENAEMLVPRVFGPVRAISKPSRGEPGKQWDETSFFDALEKLHGDDVTKVARIILEWAYSKLNIWWGRGKVTGSFVPFLIHKDVHYQLFAVYTTFGTVQNYFSPLMYKEPFDSEEKRLELRDRLNQIKDVNIPKDAITKQPSIKLSILAQENAVEQFLAIYDWVVNEILRT